MSIAIEDVLAGRVDFSGIVEPGSERLPPVHPGEILADILEDSDLSAYALAKGLNVPLNRITAILAGERAITADTALRLARFFGTSAEMWGRLRPATSSRRPARNTVAPSTPRSVRRSHESQATPRTQPSRGLQDVQALEGERLSSGGSGRGTLNGRKRPQGAGLHGGRWWDRTTDPYDVNGA